MEHDQVLKPVLAPGTMFVHHTIPEDKDATFPNEDRVLKKTAVIGNRNCCLDYNVLRA